MIALPSLITTLAWCCILNPSIASAATTGYAYSAPTGSASTTSTASSTSTGAVTHTVDVGKGGFTFVPDSINANVGDTVEFDFFPTNHSVVRAAYGYPCIPYEDTGSNLQGFFSGFKVTTEISNDPPKFSIKINNTQPIFYYCSAPDSCIGSKMIGVINPNSSVSLSHQRQLAGEASYMLQPGEAFPSEENPFSTTSAGSSATATSTSAASSGSSHGHSLSSGAIAGIAVGAAGVVVMACVLFFLWGRNKEMTKILRPSSKTAATGAADGGAPPPWSGGAAGITDAEKGQNDLKHQSVGSGYPSSELPGYSQHTSMAPSYSPMGSPPMRSYSPYVDGVGSPPMSPSMAPYTPHSDEIMSNMGMTNAQYQQQNQHHIHELPGAEAASPVNAASHPDPQKRSELGS
ncbi:MAG: hypothetical protein M1834_007564 [Cirrosporium novae-zelandiae]|nr:MAG: hypothetical protein M1834_007564 [Cirrosporium novae-zelandiae]